MKFNNKVKSFCLKNNQAQRQFLPDLREPLCWWLGSNERKAASLSAVIEGSSLSGERTRSWQIEKTWRRTGSGPEGSGPAETQSFDVEWRFDLFFKKKSLYVWGSACSRFQVCREFGEHSASVPGVLRTGILGETPDMTVETEERPI